MGSQERQEVEQLIDELRHLPEGESEREGLSARTAWSNLQFREVKAGGGTPGKRTERFEETMRTLDAALGAFGKLVVTGPITEMIAGVGWRLIQGASSAGLIKENPEASLVGRVERVEGRLIEIEKELEALRRRSGILVPIRTFEPEPYELLKDIVAVVTPAEDGFDAGFFDANIYASGDNEEEAVRNLKSMILDVFDALRHEQREALGLQARRQMTVLAEFLRAKQ